MLGNGLHDVPHGKIAMVVTHLEMMARAATRDISPPEDVTFRAVTPDLSVYRDILDRVGRDWLWYARHKLSDAELLEIIGHNKVNLYTLSLNGQDEAMLELDFRQKGACELAFFGLTSTLIGTGAGRYLMNQAITLAWDQPIERFHLHTCNIDSPQALPFYMRSGFTPYRQQIEIDDDPRLTGLVPQDTAPRVPVFR